MTHYFFPRYFYRSATELLTRELRKKSCDQSLEETLFDSLTSFASSVDQELLQTFLEDSVRATMVAGATDKTSRRLSKIRAAMESLKEEAEALASSVVNLYKELHGEDEELFEVFLEVMPALPRDALEELCDCDKESGVRTTQKCSPGTL